MKYLSKYLLVTLLTTGVFCACPSIHSWADVPQEVQSALVARQNLCAKTTFVWNVSVAKSQPNPNAKDYAQEQKNIVQQTELRAKKMGITNHSQVQRFVQRELQILQNAENGYSFNFADQWRFSNNNQVTEVVGRNQFTPSASFNYYERYEDNQGMIANTDFKSAGLAYVWATAGGSTQFFSPFQNSLNLRPDDFALFAGKNPLNMYAAKWKVTSKAGNPIVLETQQTQGAFAPFKLSMTLDATHGYVPLQIRTVGKIWAATDTVQDFQMFKGSWMPVHVTIDEHWYDIQIHRRMTLAAVKPTVTAISKIPKLSVVDYRLIGKNLFTAQIQDADRHKDPRITSYPWSGSIPSLNKLNKLQQQQNPGESSPDVGQTGAGNPSSAASMASSFLPFAGGVLCLAGGVWMFKQRRAN